MRPGGLVYHSVRFQSIMRYFSDTVLKVLESTDWSPGRNIKDSLVISPKKKMFLRAQELVYNLGLLKIEYLGRGGHKTIYFDSDDSDISKNMRAAVFGCDSYLDPSLENEPDFEAIENFKWVDLAESYVDTQLCHVGFLEDDIGYEIYIGENGYIYLAHGEEPILCSLSYVDFLNSEILSHKW